MRLWCACMAAAGVVTVAGCGGGDADSTAKERIDYSMASEPPQRFITRLAKLLETSTTKKDCLELQAISARSATSFACPPGKALSTSMASFEVVGAEEYGTGAVVDYKSGTAKDGAAIVLAVAPDRRWGVSRFGIITEPSTTTSDDDSRDAFRVAVDRYLKAVRTRDCATFADVTFTAGADGKVVCDTVFPSTKALTRRLKANPAARPSYEGGNATFGFFNLETRKPKPANLTISVVKATDKSPEPYVVLDVVPSPTAAQQRKVLEDIRRQRERERKGGQQTTPSQKPSESPTQEPAPGS